jgi:hypothetical protein
MNIYTVEIAGKTVAAFKASSIAKADELAHSEAFETGLRELESDGEPLWDGKMPIAVRLASEDEQGRWHADKARALLAKQLHVDEPADDWIAFLVPVSDLTAVID